VSSHKFNVVVVGGGFSGTILAVQLLCCDPALRVAVIEKSNPVGRGLAYSTESRFHLLNVPASNMSALPNEPGDFLRWAQANYNPAVQPRSFLSRALYGRYIAYLLKRATAAGERSRFEWVQDEAVSVRASQRQFEVKRRHGPELAAEAVVLALGNFPPANPRVPGLGGKCQRYFPLAWSKETLSDLPLNGTVLLLGSGLTSLDLIMALKSRGFHGKIHVVSRRGLLPQRHETTRPWPLFWDCQSPQTVRCLLRLIRAEVQMASASGNDWRAVIDALRPVTQEIWKFLPLHERRRFLRHLRAYWEVHRHRIAPEIADVLADLIAERQVRIYAGRVIQYHEKRNFADVTIRERNTGERFLLHVDRMINCTGSETDCRRIESPLLASLFSHGLARPDALLLGLDSDEKGRLIGADGRLSEGLYAIGPVRKGCLWETTAVPEIRVQAAELATLLVRGFAAASFAQPAGTVV